MIYGINAAVADSDPAGLNRYAQILKETEGVKCVRIADSGAELIDIVRRGNVHIIFLNMSLPREGSFRALDFLSRMGANRPEILVYSNICDESAINRALAMGARRFIFGTCDRCAVLNAVNETREIICGQRRSDFLLTESYSFFKDSLENSGITPSAAGYHFFIETMRACLLDGKHALGRVRETIELHADAFCTTAECIDNAIRAALNDIVIRPNSDAMNAAPDKPVLS